MLEIPRAERDNDLWIADLEAEGDIRSAALEDLRTRLERGLYYFLRNERSDLNSRANEEIQQMAADFVQDAVLKILENLDSFRGESKFTTWAAKIATRVAISELRRARYRDYSLEELTIDGETMPGSVNISVSAGDASNPERYTEQQSIAAIVQEGLDNILTERQREALTAVAVQGLSVETVAQMMGTNRNALYKMVHDARIKMKRHLENNGLSTDYILNLFRG